LRLRKGRDSNPLREVSQCRAKIIPLVSQTAGPGALAYQHAAVPGASAHELIGGKSPGRVLIPGEGQYGGCGESGGTMLNHVGFSRYFEEASVQGGCGEFFAPGPWCYGIA
jgi:hypothetical protein